MAMGEEYGRQFSLRTAFGLTAGAAMVCAIWCATEAVVAVTYGLFWLVFCIGAMRENRRRIAIRLKHDRPSAMPSASKHRWFRMAALCVVLAFLALALMGRNRHSSAPLQDAALFTVMGGIAGAVCLWVILDR